MSGGLLKSAASGGTDAAHAYCRGSFSVRFGGRLVLRVPSIPTANGYPCIGIGAVTGVADILGYWLASRLAIADGLSVVRFKSASLAEIW